MARGKKRLDGGPYLAAALICERMLLEKDGTVSAMRIIDTITIPNAPFARGDLLALNLTLLLTFKSGDFRGRRHLDIDVTGPSRKKEKFIEQDLDFSIARDQPESGVNVGVGMHVKWDGEGLYWLDVSLAGETITRVPFRLKLGEIPAVKLATELTKGSGK